MTSSTAPLTFALPLERRTPRSFLQKVAGLDSRLRLLVSLLVALTVSLGAMNVPISTSIRSIIVWDSFAATILLLTFVRMSLANCRSCVVNAKLHETNRLAIFLAIVTSAAASFFAVAVLLVGMAKGDGAWVTAKVTLAAATLIFSWLLVHVMFSIQYAHIFYRGRGDMESSGGDGLIFPNEANPDFFDFAYFSFGIGMTCQSSDVQIASRGFRRLALVHGLLSFTFNAVILSLGINLATGNL